MPAPEESIQAWLARQRLQRISSGGQRATPSQVSNLRRVISGAGARETPPPMWRAPALWPSKGPGVAAPTPFGASGIAIRPGQQPQPAPAARGIRYPVADYAAPLTRRFTQAMPQTAAAIGDLTRPVGQWATGTAQDLIGRMPSSLDVGLSRAISGQPILNQQARSGLGPYANITASGLAPGETQHPGAAAELVGMFSRGLAEPGVFAEGGALGGGGYGGGAGGGGGGGGFGPGWVEPMSAYQQAQIDLGYAELAHAQAQLAAQQAWQAAQAEMERQRVAQQRREMAARIGQMVAEQAVTQWGKAMPWRLPAGTSFAPGMGPGGPAARMAQLGGTYYSPQEGRVTPTPVISEEQMNQWMEQAMSRYGP